MSRHHRYLDRDEHDLAVLTAGEETGWRDDTGAPTPWPGDYWLADGSNNPDWGRTAAVSRREGVVMPKEAPPNGGAPDGQAPQGPEQRVSVSTTRE